MRGRRFAILVALVGALTACGSTSKSTTASTSGSSTTGATASATTVTTSATTAAPSPTPTKPAGGDLTDACSLLSPAEVTAVTKVTLTSNPAPGTAATCTYDSADSGIFFLLAIRDLPTSDQAGFDAMVKGQEAASAITTINGVGDGNGALAKHTDNYTAYGFVGKKALAVTVFNGAADPAANAQELLKTALGRL